MSLGRPVSNISDVRLFLPRRTGVPLHEAGFDLRQRRSKVRMRGNSVQLGEARESPAGDVASLRDSNERRAATS